MEDMTGELRLIVLRKDCFAGCNDDDATTTQLATTCKVPSQVAGEDRGGEGTTGEDTGEDRGGDG